MLILMLCLVGLGGRLLPTWMFVNSMQLFMHTPLLSADMPANLSYFMNHYLSMLRFKSESIDNSIEAWMKDKGLENYNLATNEDSSFSYLLNDCGYKHAVTRNLVIVIFMAMVLALITLIAFVYNFFKSKKKDGVTRRFAYTAWMTNFNLRFAYEFFMEICLCVLINLVVLRGASTDIIITVVAFVLFIAILLAVIFAVSLFWRGGPYMVPNVFQKKSLYNSIWAVRPLCPACELPELPAIEDIKPKTSA